MRYNTSYIMFGPSVSFQRVKTQVVSGKIASVGARVEVPSRVVRSVDHIPGGSDAI